MCKKAFLVYKVVIHLYFSQFSTNTCRTIKKQVNCDVVLLKI